MSVKYHIYHLKAILKLPRVCFKKRDLMQNLSNENEFDLHENGPYSHINGFEQRLVLTQKQKASWKWPTLTLLSISESFFLQSQNIL